MFCYTCVYFCALCYISVQCGTPFVATESSKSPLPSLPSELTEGDGGKLEEDTRSELEGIEQEDLACGKGSEVATSSRSQETEQTESVGERQGLQWNPSNQDTLK